MPQPVKAAPNTPRSWAQNSHLDSHVGEHNAEEKGAKHKSKAAEKEAAQSESKSAKEDGRKSKDKADKGEKTKEKKQKETLKDANGNDLKRPLTAYMLFNNFRRPILQKDHPGKFTRFILAFRRLLADRFVQAYWARVEELER